MYHISDIKKFLRCKLLYFYSKDENTVFVPYLRSDDNIIELLKKYLDINDCFEGVKNDQNNHFFDNKDRYEWFIKPRFVDDELRINIPVMHKVDDKYDLYFVYYSSQLKEIDYLTYRITYRLLNKLGIDVNEIYLVYFNDDYINDGNLNSKELFKTVNVIKDIRIIDYVKENEYDYDVILNEMKNTDYEIIKPVKNRYCNMYGKCLYYDRCFSDQKDLKDDSILHLVSSKHKNTMYDEGIEQLKDVDIERLEGNRVQYAQVMASKNGGLFVDKMALKHFLYRLSDRPISFIDFEWDRYLVPKYKNMKPMDALCFEFALYYIDEDNEMHHYTFVSRGDCRLEFIETLIDKLPDSGPILAYNALGAECLRLKELAETFPEYHERLMSIIDRFIDLAEPFTEGLVYDIRMHGNYSLKKLVDICSDYSYDNLSIDDGMQAVFNWRNFDKDDNDEVIQDLKQYCALDAYGLFLVYKWLIKLQIEAK